MRIALIADDVLMNQEILSDMLKDDFNIVCASDGQQVIDCVEQDMEDIAVIMLDLAMPVKSGLEVLQYLHKRQIHKRIPIIIISSDVDIATKEKCFQLGAHDYVEKPFEKYAVTKRVQNAASMFFRKNQLEYQLRKQSEELANQNAKLQMVNNKIMTVLGAVVEARSLESGEHILRVKKYTQILAKYLQKHYQNLGITDEQIKIIVEVSALHDVGKISIPDSILLKPGKLTDEEFDIMKTHTIVGYELLNAIVDIWGDEYRDTIHNVITYHHERWDGRGYPEGLKGDEIPLSAQIVALADVFDALTTKRVYKKAFSVEKAYDMILNGECGAFSDMMKEALKGCILDMVDIHLMTADIDDHD